MNCAPSTVQDLIMLELTQASKFQHNHDADNTPSSHRLLRNQGWLDQCHLRLVTCPQWIIMKMIHLLQVGYHGCSCKLE